MCFDVMCTVLRSSLIVDFFGTPSAVRWVIAIPNPALPPVLAFCAAQTIHGAAPLPDDTPAAVATSLEEAHNVKPSRRPPASDVAAALGASA